MKQLTAILFLLGMFNGLSSQQLVYLKYEPNSCIKQFVYHTDNVKSAALITQFYDYHIQNNRSQKTIIRSVLMGKYSKKEYDLSDKLMSCSPTELKKVHTLAANPKVTMYIVEEKNNEYWVYKSTRLTKETYTATGFTSMSDAYRINYSYNNDFGPADQISSTDDYKILFSGKSKRGCHPQIGFMIMPTFAYHTNTEIEYIQHIGLISEKNEDGDYRLVMVDGQPAEQYLVHQCHAQDNFPNLNGNTAKGGDVPKEYNQPTDKGSVTVVASYNKNAAKNPLLDSENTAKGGDIPKEYNQSADDEKIKVVASYDENISKNSLSDEPNTPKGGDIPKEYDQKSTSNAESKVTVTFPYQKQNIPSEYTFNTKDAAKKGAKGSASGVFKKHTVVKDDTLYNLSKKYNVTIKDLMEWNDLKEPTIKIDEELIVGVTPAPL